MRGRMLVCIVLGLLAVTPALAPASERAGDTPMGTPEGWSDDINLSNSTLTDSLPAIANSDDNLYLLWRHNYRDFFFSKSIDGGRTWSPSISIYNNDAGSIIYNDIAASGQNIHAVMHDMYDVDGIYYRNSTDGGETWNPIRRMTPNIYLWDAGNPHVFVNNSNVHIAWHDFRPGVGGLNGQIFYRRSLDGGITFDNGQGVDEDRQITFSPSTISGVDMAGDGSNISLIWNDERSGIFNLFWVLSKDNGYTWEDGLGHIGQDRQLTTTGDFQHAIAVNGSKIYIVYTTEDWPGPTYNIYYLNSSDNGITWNSPVLLSGPHSASFAPDIAIYGEKIWVMWNDNREGSHEIFFKNSTDGGISWGSDTRLTEVDGFTSGAPKITLNDSNVNVIWTDYRFGPQEIYYKRSPDFPIPTYTIPLAQGWNLLSTPLIPEDEAIDKVLENITGKWDYIQLYNSSDSDHWKTNLTYRPEQLNDLKTLDYRMGFWINVTEPGVFLTLKGQIPENTVIPLYAGWNLVGYPTLNDTMTVGNALWGTGADKIEVFDAADPYRLKEVGSTYIMKPGEGYWIHVPADSTWVVDW